MRLGKKPRVQRAILLLLAGVMLSCLGIFLSLPQTIASEVPEVSAALAGEARGALDPPPEESYPLRATGDRQKKEEIVSGWLRPVRAPPLCLGSSGSKRFAAPSPCGASMRACPHLLSGSERSLQHGTNHSTARHLVAAIG